MESDTISKTIDIEKEWKAVLTEEFRKEYFTALRNFLKEEKKQYTLFPPGKEIFSAFAHTPFSKVKVVIIGQDPYHGPQQANGLCFSVSKSVAIPPSLQNIYKELYSDCGCKIPNHGDLTSWADQGVLLLNATLTVRAGQPGSHQNKGWEIFTDSVIKILSDKKEHIVFLLWGKYAQSKENLIDQNKHLVLKAAHPSPLARGAFFGCRHFSKTNEYLMTKKIKPVDWKIE